MRAKLAVQLYGESLVGRECFCNQIAYPLTISEIVTFKFNPNGESDIARAETPYGHFYLITEDDELSFNYRALKDWHESKRLDQTHKISDKSER